MYKLQKKEKEKEKKRKENGGSHQIRREGMEGH